MDLVRAAQAGRVIPPLFLRGISEGPAAWVASLAAMLGLEWRASLASAEDDGHAWARRSPPGATPLRIEVTGLERLGGERLYRGRVVTGRSHACTLVNVTHRGPAFRFEHLADAGPGGALVFRSDKEVDLAVGDILADDATAPPQTRRIDVLVIRRQSTKVTPGARLRLHGPGLRSPACLSQVRVVSPILRHDGEAQLERWTLTTDHPVPAEPYATSPATGRVDIQDDAGVPLTRGLVVDDSKPVIGQGAAGIGREARAGLKAQPPRIVWISGPEGREVGDLAQALENELRRATYHVVRLDHDRLAGDLNADLKGKGLVQAERMRRAIATARLMYDAGMIVICSFRERLVRFSDLSTLDCLELLVHSADQSQSSSGTNDVRFKDLTEVEGPFKVMRLPALTDKNLPSSAAIVLSEIIS
jgi:bifunctional enzyme CysN/CysC